MTVILCMGILLFIPIVVKLFFRGRRNFQELPARLEYYSTEHLLSEFINSSGNLKEIYKIELISRKVDIEKSISKYFNKYYKGIKDNEASN
jgi:hypothetical protein